MNITTADSHVGEVERSIRTIKERLRACVHGLPFRRLPKVVIVAMISDCVRCLNQFPRVTGISSTMSPSTIVRGTPPPDFNAMRIEFGAYAQVFEDHDPTNTPRGRSLGAIALNPTGNTQGDYYFLSLSTGARISRHAWTELPLPDTAIARVEAIALHEGRPLIQGAPIMSLTIPNTILTLSNRTPTPRMFLRLPTTTPLTPPNSATSLMMPRPPSPLMPQLPPPRPRTKERTQTKDRNPCKKSNSNTLTSQTSQKTIISQTKTTRHNALQTKTRPNTSQTKERPWMKTKERPRSSNEPNKRLTSQTKERPWMKTKECPRSSNEPNKRLSSPNKKRQAHTTCVPEAKTILVTVSMPQWTHHTTENRTIHPRNFYRKQWAW